MGKETGQLKELTPDELKAKLATVQQALFELRIQNTRRQLEDTSKIRKTRREVSRILTILREKQK